MRLRQERFAAEIIEYLRASSRPLIDYLSKILKCLRRKYGPGHGSVCPFDIDGFVQFLFIGIAFNPPSFIVSPDVNIAPVADTPQKGRFPCSVFSEKEGHRRVKFYLFGLLEDGQIKRIPILYRIFRRIKFNALQVHYLFFFPHFLFLNTSYNILSVKCCESAWKKYPEDFRSLVTFLTKRIIQNRLNRNLFATTRPTALKTKRKPEN